MAPVALDALLCHATVQMLAPAALVAAQVSNVHNDWEKNPRGFSAADFLPGAEPYDEAADLRRFAQDVVNGTVKKPSEEELAEFIEHNRKLITPPDRQARFK